MKTRRLKRTKRQSRRHTGGSRKPPPSTLNNSPLGIFEMNNYKPASPKKSSLANSPRNVEILSPRTQASDPRTAGPSPAANLPGVLSSPPVYYPGAIPIPGKKQNEEYVFAHGVHVPVSAFTKHGLNVGLNDPNEYFKQEMARWDYEQRKLAALGNRRAWSALPSRIPGLVPGPVRNQGPLIRVITPQKRTPPSAAVLKSINRYGYVVPEGMRPMYMLPFAPLSKANYEKHTANTGNGF